MTNAYPKDVFGRPVQVGDMVAAGMTYNRSSVLRIGEVIAIKNTLDYNKQPTKRFSIRIRWRNNGDMVNQYSWGSVKDSNILYDESFRLAKVVILPPGWVDQFPADIDHDA